VTSPTSRGEETRQRIVDAAMRLFEEKGYEKTTMRAVAGEAGVSLGNAYYYFASKDHLVQGFYAQIQTLHEAAVRGKLGPSESLAERWLIATTAFIDVAEPYHQFAGKFFVTAADPASPLSPFSTDSAPARQASTDIMRSVVEGARIKADKRLLDELPELLWLAHMGVVLFWVHDSSPGQRRTRMLVRRVAPLMERIISLSRLRPLRSNLHQVLDLIADLRTPDGLDELDQKPQSSL
jgi:AcrR family transcriptional regulator